MQEGEPERKRLTDARRASSASWHREILPNEQTYIGNLPWRNLALLPGTSASSRRCEDSGTYLGRVSGRLQRKECKSKGEKKHIGNLLWKM